MVISKTLRSYNYDPVVAYRGMSGLEHLAENPQIQLIVVDLLMPEMDGFEFIGKLREEPEWRNTPVIVCTAVATKDSVARSASLGCRSYLLKPVTEEQLMLKVRQALDTSMPILEHKDATMERLGVALDSYEETIAAFATMLDAKIRSLEGMIRGDVEEISMDLADVREGALLLGGKRLMGTLGESPWSSESDIAAPTRADWELLLREMRSLRRALAPSNVIRFTV